MSARENCIQGNLEFPCCPQVLLDLYTTFMLKFMVMKCSFYEGFGDPLEPSWDEGVCGCLFYLQPWYWSSLEGERRRETEHWRSSCPFPSAQPLWMITTVESWDNFHYMHSDSDWRYITWEMRTQGNTQGAFCGLFYINSPLSDQLIRSPSWSSLIVNLYGLLQKDSC